MKKSSSKAREAKPNKRRVNFQTKADPGSSVYIAGSFNGWQSRKKMKEERKGHFATNMMLAKGSHEYKFIVDGEWIADTECMDFVPNEMGTINSVVRVG